MRALKRRLLLLLMVLAGLGITMITSTDSLRAEQKAPEGKAAKPIRITLAGYSVGGSSAVVGEAIGEAIKRTAPGSAFTYEPGQSGANEVTVATGKTELGLSHVFTTKAAMEGKEFYKKTYPNLRAIAYLHDTYETMVFRKDAGITSIEQIKEKKFPLMAGVNTKNSVMEAMARYALEAYGISYNDIDKWGGKINFLASNPTIDLMRNKRAHAFIGGVTPPHTPYNELAINVDLIWLPMSDEAIQYVAKKMGGGRKVAILKEWHPKFMSKDLPAVGVPNILITSTEIPEEEIYLVTKALVNHLDYIHKVSGQLAPMTKATMVKEIGGIPLHPGAEKFYREMGML